MRYKDRRKGIPKMGDLNLAPMMNLMVTLIPLLLLSASFMELVVLNTSLPIYGSVGEPEEKPRLGLTIAITDRGFVIAGQGGLLKVEEKDNIIGRTPRGDYDYITLSEKLFEIKNSFPDEQSVIIVPEAGTKFEAIISTMDASREYMVVEPEGVMKRKIMFPNVVLGGGIL